MKKSGILSLLFAFVLLLSLPLEKADAAIKFKDVKDGHWSEEQIYRAVELKIIKGYEDGTFRPGKALTREEAAIMISNALKLDTEKAGTVDYKDVSDNRYAYKYIVAVTNEKLMEGYNGNFNPTDPLKRQDMAIIIKKAFNLQADGKVPFTDVTENYAYDAIRALYSNGITTGYSLNKFKPTQSITREEFVVFLDRALNQKPSMASYLKEVYANESKLASYQFEGDMNFGVSIPEFTDDPTLTSLFEDIDVKMTGSYQAEPLLMEGNVTVTINGDFSELIGEPNADGIVNDVHFIMNTDKMWMKFPIGTFPLPEEAEGKYIEIDMAELNELSNQPALPIDLETQQQFALAIQNLYFDYFANSLYKEVGKEEIGLENNADVDKVVKFELKNEMLAPFIDVVFTKFMPDYIELLKDPKNAEALGLTEEDVNSLLESLPQGKLLEIMIAEMSKYVTINKFHQYDAIHKEKYILSTLMDLDVELTLDAENTFGLRMAFDFNKQNVNKPVQIAIPDESQVVPFSELLKLEEEYYYDEELELDI